MVHPRVICVVAVLLNTAAQSAVRLLKSSRSAVHQSTVVGHSTAVPGIKFSP
jgi:hypothetical protein